MIICVPVNSDGTIDPRWGRANQVAVVELFRGQAERWQEYDVRWGELHDEGTEGSHHARIVRFLLEHGVQTVVAGHMGPPMRTTLTKMGVELHLGANGNAREAVRAAVNG